MPVSSLAIAVAALSVFVICASCLVTTEEGFRLKDYIPGVGMIASWHSCKKKNRFVDCSNAVKTMWRIRKTDNNNIANMFKQVEMTTVANIIYTLNDVLKWFLNNDNASLEAAKKEIGQKGVDAFSIFIKRLSQTDRKELVDAAAHMKLFFR